MRVVKSPIKKTDMFQTYLLFSHGSISMFTVAVKKLQLHTLFKLNTSLFPQLQQFQLF